MGKIKKVHFVGIGGTGMCGIAEVLLNLGYKISGSDLKENEAIKRLKSLGADIKIGHKEENVHDADLIVFSSAISEANCEILEAKKRKITIIPRAEMLGELMRMKYSIAIAGAHGKTSTTSMIALILENAGLDPTIIIGGRLKTLGSSAKLGKGEFMIAEADESDRSFLKLFPSISVITNIDAEHLDQYKDIEDIEKTFIEFANRIPFFGSVIVCLDDFHTQNIIPELERKVITYGMSSQSDVFATKISFNKFNSDYVVCFGGKEVEEINLQVPGYHSIYNSLAAICVAMELEISLSVIKDSLRNFPGADRRFQLKGMIDDITVIDDYAHHPTEIRVTLDALKKGWGNRVIAVFQPHRYTRLQKLMDDFPRSFYQADEVIITSIYPAGENSIEGVSSQVLYEKFQKYGVKNVHLIEDMEEIPNMLKLIAKPGDIVITLGAGNINIVAEKFMEFLEKGK
ncbi:MAG: UDP-N-acetylmuramate--L-alanine ligase [Acidobacteriota bacterium]